MIIIITIMNIIMTMALAIIVKRKWRRRKKNLSAPPFPSEFSNTSGLPLSRLSAPCGTLQKLAPVPPLSGFSIPSRSCPGSFIFFISLLMLFFLSSSLIFLVRLFFRFFFFFSFLPQSYFSYSCSFSLRDFYYYYYYHYNSPSFIHDPLSHSNSLFHHIPAPFSLQSSQSFTFPFSQYSLPPPSPFHSFLLS